MRYQPSTRRLMAPVSATRQHSQILAKPSPPSVEGGHALAFSIGAYLELLPIKTISASAGRACQASLALVVGGQNHFILMGRAGTRKQYHAPMDCPEAMASPR